ncbi:MAG: hypothetical protein LBL86_07525 [Coriobacteriales bacterium]|jgi:hypothetical protein|nr:hypothetical protein [Coriobacteriales bacterium]
MLKRLAVTCLFFVLVAASVYPALTATAPEGASLPERITPDTPCPVAGCTQPDGGCHAAAAAPVPDGGFVMLCPKVEGCADATCHAWDRLTAHYRRPSDSSMNLWILAPVLFTVGLVLLVRKIR